ncbi:MAG: metalloregulator ArsR/SmtB family transcription factor [Ginsengibacter sp.]
MMQTDLCTLPCVPEQNKKRNSFNHKPAKVLHIYFAQTHQARPPPAENCRRVAKIQFLFVYLRIKYMRMTATKRKFTDKQELVARFANALANPIRVAILELLANQSCCYHGNLSEELHIAKSTLSQHLKVLKDAGLIQGEINPPKTKYCVNKEYWAMAKGLMIGFFG